MITYKYKIQNQIDISKYLRPYNSVVRYAYNRFREIPGISIDEVVRIVQKNMSHIEILDFTLLRYAVLKASYLRDKAKIIFGGRKLFEAIKFFKYKKNPKVPIQDLQSKYQEKRANKFLFLRGACGDPCGNRKAELDSIDKNSVILKFSKDDHIAVELPQLSKKHREHLCKLQDLCAQNKGCFSIEVNNEYICISFEEYYIKKEKSRPYIDNRLLSIDLNPNYIGLSICDWSGTNTKKIIHKEIIDVTKLTALKQDTYKKHKRDYETSEINRHIIDLAKHYRCELVVFEKLNIKSQDFSRGRKVNRLINNCWNRTKLLQNLIKRSVIEGTRYLGVVAAYSSFIGQMTNEAEYDSIAASLELSRRAYLFSKAIKSKVKPRGIVYPTFDVNALPTRWKERAKEEGIKSWKKLYLSLKKSKSRYRFLFDLDIFKGISFSLYSCKSLVLVHGFA